jgi:hypothetical protein
VLSASAKARITIKAAPDYKVLSETSKREFSGAVSLPFADWLLF